MKTLYGRAGVAISRVCGMGCPKLAPEKGGSSGVISPGEDNGDGGASESEPCQSSSSGSSARLTAGTSVTCLGTPETVALVALAGAIPLVTLRESAAW